MLITDDVDKKIKSKLLIICIALLVVDLYILQMRGLCD